MVFWSGVSLVLAALLLGTTFAHVLEIRAKARMDGALWTTLQHRLYAAFATVGGAVEIGAIVSTAALALMARPGTTRSLAGAACACFAIAFVVVWVGIVEPVNRKVARWEPAAVPPDWQRWREQWDTGHALRFCLHLLGFVFLVMLLAAHASAPAMGQGRFEKVTIIHDEIASATAGSLSVSRPNDFMGSASGETAL
jgi:hypothetical protein